MKTLYNLIFVILGSLFLSFFSTFLNVKKNQPKLQGVSLNNFIYLCVGQIVCGIVAYFLTYTSFKVISYQKCFIIGITGVSIIENFINKYEKNQEKVLFGANESEFID